MIPGPFRIVTSTELSSPSTTITLSDFSAIPAGSKHLVILLNAGASSGLRGIYMTINGDSGANYAYSSEFTTAPSTKTSFGASSQPHIVAPAYMTAGTNRFSGGIYIIPRYAETTYHKNVLFLGGDSEYSTQYTAARWANTAAVTSVSFFINTDTFVSGSVAYLAVIDETYKVASETLTSDGSVTLSTAGTEDDLVFVTNGRSNRAYQYDDVEIQLNGDTDRSNDAATTNYRSVFFYHWNGTFYTGVHTAGSGAWSRQNIGNIGATWAGAGVTGSSVGLIQRSTNGTYYPHILAFSGYVENPNEFTWHNSIFRTVTAAITSVKFISQNSTALVAGFYAAIYKLPRNRILNQTLGSNTEPVGGTLSDTTSPAIAGHLYGRGTSIYDRTVTFGTFNGEGEASGASYASMGLFGYNGTMYAESWSDTYNGHIDLETTSGGSPSNLFGGGTTIVIAPSKTDRHKHRFNASGSQALCWQSSSRWKNTAAVTQWTHYANAGAFLTGTQFQVEGITTQAAATSGFFFRFL